MQSVEIVCMLLLDRFSLAKSYVSGPRLTYLCEPTYLKLSLSNVETEKLL